jgi:hypothetical protein
MSVFGISFFQLYQKLFGVLGEADLILFTDQDLIEFTQTVYYILFFRGD